MTETIMALIPRERCLHAACMVDDSALQEAVATLSTELEGQTVDLKGCNPRQLPFGGEYFEVIITDEDALLEDDAVIEQIKKALQKNRSWIIISRTVDQWMLAERLEPFGFSDFSTIAEGEFNINLAKKWFSL